MCERCVTLEQVVSDLQESERILTEEIEVLQHLLSRSVKAEVALKNKIDQGHEKDPLRADITTVLEDWRQKTGHPKSKIPLSGTRAEKVRARLKNGFTVDQLLKANTGAARYPYVVNAQRRPQGDKAQRFDDAELIFRNEKTVEKFMELADVQPAQPEQQEPVQQIRRRPTRPVDRVTRVFRNVRPELTVNGHRQWTSDCPHNAHHQGSVVITESPQGCVFLHCNDGCTEEQIVDAAGLGFFDLLPLERQAA